MISAPSVNQIRFFSASAFAKATELRQRIWFTLGALLVFRLGTYIPMPGIDPAAFSSAFKGQSQGILGMFNMLSGGAVERMAIFALGIMPYISASIIVQLLSTVSPRMEALKKEGEAGRKTLNQYTRMGTVVLAAVQAFAIVVGVTGLARADWWQNAYLAPSLASTAQALRPWLPRAWAERLDFSPEGPARSTRETGKT